MCVIDDLVCAEILNSIILNLRSIIDKFKHSPVLNISEIYLVD